jgi:hypothetical protein
MNLDGYNYEIDESFQTYEFVSEGTNGKTTKVAAYAIQYMAALCN